MLRQFARCSRIGTQYSRVNAPGMCFKVCGPLQCLIQRVQGHRASLAVCQMKQQCERRNKLTIFCKMSLKRRMLAVAAQFSFQFSAPHVEPLLSIISETQERNPVLRFDCTSRFRRELVK